MDNILHMDIVVWADKDETIDSVIARTVAEAKIAVTSVQAVEIIENPGPSGWPFIAITFDSLDAKVAFAVAYFGDIQNAVDNCALPESLLA